MNNTKWTKEQRQAIYTKNCNLLVAAGAGAGKTAVLVERIIEKILDLKEPVDIDKLLVVTFTNAAASEMRERIGDAISKKLEENPELKILRKQLTLLNKSSIMTIHSFCLQVIRSNFHKIDIDPNFRIADETECVLMKQEAIDDVFEKLYEEENISFLNLIDAYSRKTDIKLQDLIFRLHSFAKSSPLPYEWLINMAEVFNVGDDFHFNKSKWANIFLDNIKIDIEGYRDIMEKSIDIIENSQGIEHYYEPFKMELDFIKSLLEEEDFQNFRRILKNYKPVRLPSKRSKDVDKEIKDKVKGERDKIKNKIIELKDELLNYENDFIVDQFKSVYPFMKSLSELVILFDENYKSRKKERDLIDFNDIEHLCFEILTERNEKGNIVPSEIALNYRKKFEEVLIDEYQDSNLVQEVIMTMVSRTLGHWYVKDGSLIFKQENIDKEVLQRGVDIPNRFMVGDVKQSIYKFRQAEPEIFLEKYNNYDEEAGSSNREIKLFKNFRSRKEVIDGVNYIFKQIMSKRVGELDYTEDEALNIGAKYSEEVSGESIDLCLMDKSSEVKSDIVKEQNLEEEELDNIQLEGRMVARKINHLMKREGANSFKVFDKNINAYRDIKYKDIVILLRTTSNWASVFIEELTRENIPVFADTNSGYFETFEIKTMLSLLEIVDNPLQDIPILSVLRSPIASFSDEELIDIRLVNKNIPFYESMVLIYKLLKNEEIEEYHKFYLKENQDLTKALKEDTKEKIINFIDKLNCYREKSLHMDIDEFIWYLYVDTGYYGYVGALPGGEQRQANLRILFQRAKQYENTSYKGLFNFINFINKLKFSNGDMGSAKILGENENVVRIMSIHKSKGLEFPVVILSGMGKKFNTTDMNKNIIFHKELGYGPDYVDIERRISYPTLIKNIIKNKIKLETLSEEMRILYVAFTRAKEKLIMTGLISKLEKNINKWVDYSEKEEKIPKYVVLNGQCYLDWIGPAVFKHKDSLNIRRELGILSGGFNNLEDDSKWNIEIWNKEDLLKEKVEEQEQNISQKIKDLVMASEESNYKDEIDKRLSYKYKFKELSKIPTKVSVSEIKRRFSIVSNEEAMSIYKKVELKKPLFLKEDLNISGAERGTIIHLVMQHLDLNKVSNYEEIECQINELVHKEFITKKSSEVVNIDKILKFFKSELGQKMINSNKVKREVPFFIKIPVNEVYKNLEEDIYNEEELIVQGIIDAYFEEDAGLTLIDYKTDYVKDINEIKKRYKLQIDYYEKALEKITDKKVIHKYLYLFSINKVVEIF
ncbi:helicase-exonuclease AddAB subunit AddA [Clostridium niameyense]|uniref:helicase-exonuclease AddAB subunit AddA n=1 Tax=Clostridium niameyense TaxID=1622073 RepID=UPI00067EDEC0|nr:helicase-exonuclease AddAB subunit AddA [Clostridium niameyense]